jgi:hypothetical protein
MKLLKKPSILTHPARRAGTRLFPGSVLALRPLADGSVSALRGGRVETKDFLNSL